MTPKVAATKSATETAEVVRRSGRKASQSVPKSAPQRILANRWFLSGIPLSGGLSGRLSGGLSGGLSDGLSGGLSGRPKVTPKVTPKSDPQSNPPKDPQSDSHFLKDCFLCCPS